MRVVISACSDFAIENFSLSSQKLAFCLWQNVGVALEVSRWRLLLTGGAGFRERFAFCDHLVVYGSQRPSYWRLML